MRRWLADRWLEGDPRQVAAVDGEGDHLAVLELEAACPFLAVGEQADPVLLAEGGLGEDVHSPLGAVVVPSRRELDALAVDDRIQVVLVGALALCRTASDEASDGLEDGGASRGEVGSVERAHEVALATAGVCEHLELGVCGRGASRRDERDVAKLVEAGLACVLRQRRYLGRTYVVGRLACGREADQHLALVIRLSGVAKAFWPLAWLGARYSPAFVVDAGGRQAGVGDVVALGALGVVDCLFDSCSVRRERRAVRRGSARRAACGCGACACSVAPERLRDLLRC